MTGSSETRNELASTIKNLFSSWRSARLRHRRLKTIMVVIRPEQVSENRMNTQE